MAAYTIREKKRIAKTLPHVVLKPVRKRYLMDDLEQLEQHLKAGRLPLPLVGRQEQLLEDGQFAMERSFGLMRDANDESKTIEEVYVEDYNDHFRRYAGFSRVQSIKSRTVEFVTLIIRIKALMRQLTSPKEKKKTDFFTRRLCLGCGEHHGFSLILHCCQKKKRTDDLCKLITSLRFSFVVNTRISKKKKCPITI
jgi:hypothetical protein